MMRMDVPSAVSASKAESGTPSPEERPYPRFGQRPETSAKYRDAILACSDIGHIGMNISGIAREFGLSPAALNNQLRRHFPEIIPDREALRRRLGIADGIFRGATRASVQQYSRAVHLLETTDLSVQEVAERCGVSYSGLREHILYYHKRIAEARHLTRVAASGRELRYGEKNGSNQPHMPRKETVERYAQALELLRTTSLPITEICYRCGVRTGAFRSYLYNWHKDDMLRRRVDGPAPIPSASEPKRYSVSAAERYAPAMALLRSGSSMHDAAFAAGITSTDRLRWYVREHDPELAARVKASNRVLLPNGTSCKRESWEQFKDAAEEYLAADVPVTELAARYGLNAKSLRTFLRKHFPSVVQARSRRCKDSEESLSLPDL